MNNMVMQSSGFKKLLFVGSSILAVLGLISCIPIGMDPSPRMLRKDPSLKKRRPVYPDSILPRKYLIDFPYRNIEEIRLSWKVVAGIKLKSREIGRLKKLILSNVERYWQYRFPNQEVGAIILENVSVSDAQILLAAGYPLLLYSAYDIRHRRRPYTFEGFDVVVGYQGITAPGDKRVSFKLNSGLRGYIDSEKMLTGSLLDVPRLKTSQVHILQVVVVTPPGVTLENVYKLLQKKYEELAVSTYTLPVKDEKYPMGSIR